MPSVSLHFFRFPKIRFSEVHTLPMEGAIAKWSQPVQGAADVLSVIPREDWETKCVVPERQGIVLQRAFQPVDQKRSAEWFRRLKEAGF